jgi:NAD(P)-dependent dehydrogenase (short-subunit alcohol dehydrogenase family)
MEENQGAPNFRLDGKRALITGAGRGLGLAAAHALAHFGAEVVLAARTLSEVEAAAANITRAGGRAEAIALDIRDVSAVKLFHTARHFMCWSTMPG